MALKTLVKVGNISSLSDARYCAGMGVDILGFSMVESSDDYVSADDYKEIVGWVSGPKLAGEFSGASLEQIIEKNEALKFDFLQINDIDIANFLARDHKVIYALDLSGFSALDEAVSHLNKLNDDIAYVLVDSDEQESSFEVDLSKLSANHETLNGYGVNADNVIQQISGSAVAGIALKGSVETKPGFKDYDELADILEALEDDD